MSEQEICERPSSHHCLLWCTPGRTGWELSKWSGWSSDVGEERLGLDVDSISSKGFRPKAFRSLIRGPFVTDENMQFNRPTPITLLPWAVQSQRNLFLPSEEGHPNRFHWTVPIKSNNKLVHTFHTPKQITWKSCKYFVNANFSSTDSKLSWGEMASRSVPEFKFGQSRGSEDTVALDQSESPDVATWKKDIHPININ